MFCFDLFYHRILYIAMGEATEPKKKISIEKLNVSSRLINQSIIYLFFALNIFFINEQKKKQTNYQVKKNFHVILVFATSNPNNMTPFIYFFSLKQHTQKKSSFNA